MITNCWAVVRQVAPRLHRHTAHLVSRSGRILHRLRKFAPHPFHPVMLVCRALPLGLASAGFLNVTPAEPPGRSAATSSFVQPLGRFIQPYQTSALPPLPSPFACCSGQFPPPGDPGIKLAPTPPIGDPGPVGDPPVIVTTFVDPGPPPASSVDEPSSGAVVLGALAGLLLIRRSWRSRMGLPARLPPKALRFCS